MCKLKGLYVQLTNNCENSKYAYVLGSITEYYIYRDKAIVALPTSLRKT